MKYICTIILAIALSSSLTAQDPNKEVSRDEDRIERRQKKESRVESQKVAFITQKLNLSPSEAQSFWPLYNEFQTKLKELRQQKKMEWEKEDFTEVEANNFLENIFSEEQKELDVKKEYFNKLKSAIDTKKVAKLYIIEKKFREEVLNNIKRRMNKRRGKEKRNRG